MRDSLAEALKNLSEKPNDMWHEVTKMDLSMISNGLLRVPKIKNMYPTLKWDGPKVSAEIEYEFQKIALEKVKLDVDMLNWNGSDSRYLQEVVTNKMMREIHALRRNDIPVFNIEHNLDRMRGDIFFDYQIPECLVYKSFYVLNDFKEATRKAGDYAKGKVAEFLERY